MSWILSAWPEDHGLQYRAIITLNKNHVEGRISTPDGVMHLKSSQGEIQLIDYKDEGAEKTPFGNDVVLPEEDIPLSEYDQPLYSEQDEASLAAAPSYSSGNTIVDVLVLYNQTFVNENGGNPAVRIDQLVALANQAYLDSQVSMQIRVVAMKLIDYSNLNTYIGDDKSYLRENSATRVYSTVSDGIDINWPGYGGYYLFTAQSQLPGSNSNSRQASFI